MVGLIISSSSNYQDFRRIGFFKKNYYIYKNVLSASLFNLGGLPFSIGFFSKYFLLTNINILSFNYFSLLFLHLSCYNGFFYSINIYQNVFNGFNKSNKTNKVSNNILYKKSLFSNILTPIIFISIISLTFINISILFTCFDTFVINSFKFEKKNLIFLEFFYFIFFIFIFFYFFKINFKKIYTILVFLFVKILYTFDLLVLLLKPFVLAKI